MSAPRIAKEIAAEIVQAHARGETISATARRLRIDRSTVGRYWPRPDEAPATIPLPPRPEPETEPAVTPAAALEPAALAAKLRKGPMAVGEIARAIGGEPPDAIRAVEALKAEGHNVLWMGDRAAIASAPQPASSAGRVVEYVSRPDNTFHFGACGDAHLCSKYERLDALNDLYDVFAAEGVDRVFNTGNWVDGEARFNQFDIHTYGVDGQLAYLAKHYPSRPGISTYAVAGDDHEGWYGQRTGIDIGKHAERTMRDAGRTDWHDLGYIECFVRLVNANTGAATMLSVHHPGGGSAYALSYSVQKIVESYDGGNKPAVLLVGHYHKMEVLNVRNVWCVQTGCTQDQTPFMRKKRLAAHVGGVVCRAVQDPATGAITRFRTEQVRYFDQGYYVNDRWSHARPAVLPPRGR